MTTRQTAVKAIIEDKLDVRNPSILAKLLEDYGKLKAERFAQWICKSGYDSKQIMVSPRWVIGYGKKEYTTEELYQKFIKNHPEPPQ